jgi:RNA polymerase sigma-70 factor (ECF subfamily)
VGMELSELVRQAADGNREAADQIVCRFAPSVRAAVRRRVRPGLRARFDTDDVVQSTMAVALRDLPGLDFQDERRFRAWLLRIAERRLKMAVRLAEAARRDVGRERRGVGEAERGAAQTSVSEVAQREDERRCVRESVAALADLDRKVVELRGYHGMSHKEVAAVLGLPSEDAARLRFRRALEKIQAALRSTS